MLEWAQGQGAQCAWVGPAGFAGEGSTVGQAGVVAEPAQQSQNPGLHGHVERVAVRSRSGAVRGFGGFKVECGRRVQWVRGQVGSEIDCPIVQLCHCSTVQLLNNDTIEQYA
ncbi:hypothetical protein GCM10022220_00640 [Actinocatenispora rupis]|uniref:Uncharacterized protein n=1 Tax=Actinocatenispora rupis TaxID=519421 RepID=A0A8J3NFS7_9ACTN|nr:hypothetical protein Aru02nite_50180 [Actinocatenispora rupis]